MGSWNSWGQLGARGSSSGEAESFRITKVKVMDGAINAEMSTLARSVRPVQSCPPARTATSF